MSKAIRRHALSLSLAAALALPVAGIIDGAIGNAALAEPPAWAPAYGYRAKKHHRHHKHRHHAREGQYGRHAHDHYERRVYVSPIGVDLGRCNREAVGMILGGAAGAAVGSTVGKGEERLVATIGGTIVGLLAGGMIGRAMDRADGYCVAQALAHVDDGETVIWSNPDRDADYRVTPTRSFRSRSDRFCREYTTEATIGDRRERMHGTACLRDDGSWQLAG